VPFGPVILVLALVTVGVVIWRAGASGGGSDDSHLAASGSPTSTPTPDGSHSPGGSPQPSSSSASPTVAPDGVETPGPINTSFPGLTTFRGNASRDYYGEGPLPKHPKVLWEYPQSGGLCAQSTGIDGTKTWCGTGWTGQPNVIPHPDGTIEIREGAYDDHYHFWNGLTGQPMRPDLVTGDLAKGSATSDPDGYPLYYAGSRDNLFRIVAMDRKKPTVLWSMDANTSVPNPVWNDDWDGAALVVGDYLLEGGENSWFYVVKLNRHYDSHHKVQVDPKIVVTQEGWDQQFLNDLGDDSVSIENSVAYRDGVVYFGNSGGLVQGWDISDVLNGGTKYHEVFRYWVGDETDASIVIDKDGSLYVGRHYSFNIPNRSRARDEQVGGSLIKLDPSKPKDPLVWTVDIGGSGPDGGLLGTPALYDGIVYAPGSDGHILAVDAKSGKVYWDLPVAPPLNDSPVVIDHQLVVGDCQGVLHDYDISNPHKLPKELWHVQLSGCIESTPAVWHGMLWVGARGGKFYGIGDAK
jgi:outer membrane protein assembly factor BamB